MMNKTIWVKIMEQLIARFIICVTVISWYSFVWYLVYEFFPLERRNVYWGLLLLDHFHAFCGIAIVYSIFFPNKKILLAVFLLLTIVNIYFFTPWYPYRSIELSLRAYICLAVPMVISWYIRKSLKLTAVSATPKERSYEQEQH